MEPAAKSASCAVSDEDAGMNDKNSGDADADMDGDHDHDSDADADADADADDDDKLNGNGNVNGNIRRDKPTTHGSNSNNDGNNDNDSGSDGAYDAEMNDNDDGDDSGNEEETTRQQHKRNAKITNGGKNNKNNGERLSKDSGEASVDNHQTTTNNGGDNGGDGDGTGDTNASAATAAPAAAIPPAPLPLLKGTLSYISNELTRKHVIRGTWNFESSTENAPQRFELVRTLGPDEDPTELPKDGTFNGSFNLAYTHVSAKGKKKEKSRVISETGVEIKFTERMGEDDAFDVHGEGTNTFGVFTVIGTAVRVFDGPEKKYCVEMRKRYKVVPGAAGAATATATATAVAEVESPGGKKVKSKSKKRKLDKSILGGSAPAVNEPLPDPSPPHESNVICLRGRIMPTSSAQDGVVHLVSGMWSSGLDMILADPDNKRGLCNEFGYEYRGTVANDTFPISGKYTGFFRLTDEKGNTSRIPERDVTLKFKKNNAGFYNVEGRGANIFGKYNISGTMDTDNIITIFRHFLPAPVKARKSIAPVVTKVPVLEPDTDDSERMTLDDVTVPDGDDLEPLVGPEDGLFAALSRGVLKVNDDGAHTSTGKWAVTRTHYNSNMASNFHFGLEEHHAKLGAEEMKKNDMANGDGGICFPVDSANYKGSFKMKRGTAKLQSIVDGQIVMKFRKNTSGSYNVYGKGKNIYGVFDLVGTLILHGRGSGHIELFRIYQAPSPEPQPEVKNQGKALPTSKNAAKKAANPKVPSALPFLDPAASAIRRESSRQTKLPSRLEEDDPLAMRSRMMEKCTVVLKMIREKDLLGGSFFAEPVDPVAHGIPTYHQIITNPMDLSTIQAKMDANEVESPEEFSRLVRLVFENAVKFNIDPTHVVHQSARSLLTLFTNKFREVERIIDTKKPTKKEQKEQKKKQQEDQKRLDTERKRQADEDKDPRLKQLRLLHSSSHEVAKSFEAFDSASSAMNSASVTRNEFSLMTNVMRQLKTQVFHLQGLVTTLAQPSIPGAVAHVAQYAAQDVLSSLPAPVESTAPKKSNKRKKTKPDKPPVEPMLPLPVVPVRAPAPAPAPRAEIPLTHEEQEELTYGINMMSEDKLEVVIGIIRESNNIGDEDEEIDLEIDQLSTATQRKLFNFLLKVSICNLFCQSTIFIWHRFLNALPL